MLKICTSCAGHPSLKKYIEEKGVELPTCEICGAVDVKNLANYTREFRQLFKALIRFYHSEWEYNGHFGGDHIESLFYRPNEILNWREGLDDLALEEAILPLIEKVYEDDEEGISLFAGYNSSGTYNMLLEALREESHHGLDVLLGQLHHKNFFLLEDDARALIARIEPEIIQEIPAGETLFRARIGFAQRGRPADWSSNPTPDYRPFSGAAIGAPPPLRSLAGRLNRQGTSFLYLASSAQTAIAEVRPHPGQFVSLGKFRAVGAIRVANFAEIDFLAFSQSDARLDDLHLIGSLDRMFKQPIPPDMRHLYCLPQLFSDVLRQEGYDAIRFNSSVDNGYNLTVFDPSNFRYIPDDASVHVVKKVEYALELQTPMTEEEAYTATQGPEDVDWKPVEM